MDRGGSVFTLTDNNPTLALLNGFQLERAGLKFGVPGILAS
jgi:hypothetical protein